MAAWRYGDQFGRRRKRQMLVTGAALGAVATVYAGILAVGVSAGAFAGVHGNPSLWDGLLHGQPGKVVARLVGPDGEPLVVERRHAPMTRLLRDGDDFQLWLEHRKGRTLLVGERAARAAAQLLPTVNRFGGSRMDVQQAVKVLESAGSAEAVLREVRRRHGVLPDLGAEPVRTGQRPWFQSEKVDPARKPDNPVPIEKKPGVLHGLPTIERLALEMALHEEAERRAMEGELAALEAAWREAEEVARIADALLVPEAVSARLEAMRSESADNQRPG
jgi:hypothetical protein